MKSQAQYTMKASARSGDQLTDSATEKDSLGVLVNNQLSFRDHVLQMLVSMMPVSTNVS